MTYTITALVTWTIVGFTQVGPNTCAMDLLTPSGEIQTIELACDSQ